MSAVVLHYGELALKGRNRLWFLSALTRSVRASLRGLKVRQVRSLIGRIVVTIDDDSEWPEVRERLACLPGIDNFALATRMSMDLDAIAEAIVRDLPERPVPSFRVRARRADKRFPVPTPEIERRIGARVQAARGWPVDLSNPAFVITVEFLTEDAYYFFERTDGTGGLPIGTGGRTLALLSGGIDSPVAAWRLIRRGCRTDFVHFHSYPILSNTSQEKARELVRLLTRSQLRSRLFLVPFGGIQQQVVVSVPPALRVVIYRRMMLRIAEALAKTTGAQALVTGDAVGQVASQTIENLAVVGSVASLPLLRPLVGMDKEEITRDAQRIGTYAVSIIPDEDCCTLFTPRYPSTRASAEAVEAAERALDVSGLVDAAVATAVGEVAVFPGRPARIAPTVPESL
ncbi:MAG: tRNA 4-thiouridine(8) synthase ThiI [Acidobacteria bacterium SCN 69-37]|nr:MAG: tRNA 4-thiouridine(8) synthase ThiI [Acidobacteria bacterium SCN 69-37]